MEVIFWIDTGLKLCLDTRKQPSLVILVNCAHLGAELKQKIDSHSTPKRSHFAKEIWSPFAVGNIMRAFTYIIHIKHEKYSDNEGDTPK